MFTQFGARFKNPKQKKERQDGLSASGKEGNPHFYTKEVEMPVR